MKAGEKYIIEIETVVNGLAKIKDFNTLVFDEFGLDKLEQIPNGTKFLSPADLELIKVTERREGYEQGFKDGVKHQASMIPQKTESHVPQIGDIYRSKSDGSKIIITYKDAGMSMVLLANGDNSYYDAEELNKYYEFVENRADVLEPIKIALL